MKIEFDCVCGKHYSVKAEYAGKKAKCKKCGYSILVPHLDASEDEIGVEVVDVEVVNEEVAKEVVLSAVRAQNATVPDPEHVISGTYASNPGQVKISKLKYISSYPKWFWIWHGLLLVSIGLCFWSFGFIPFVLFFIAACWLFWKRVTTQFRSGCANPGQVVSIDPPLIAAFTNLSKGVYDTNIIKILSQPIKKLSTGVPTIGQKIATVALYEDNFPCGEHWSSFDPKPVACVTKNQQAISGVMSTFSAEDWREMDEALLQVPQPYQPGHYRIYSPEEFAPRHRPSGDEIKEIVRRGLHEQGSAFLFHKLDQEKLTTIGSFTPAAGVSSTWGIVSALGDECKEALVFSDVGIFYNFKETGSGRIGYEDVVGALSSNSGLEIMLRDRTRIHIPKTHFLSGLLGQLDMIFDQISGRI